MDIDIDIDIDTGLSTYIYVYVTDIDTNTDTSQAENTTSTGAQRCWCTSDGHEERGKDKYYGLQLHNDLSISSGDQDLDTEEQYRPPEKVAGLDRASQLHEPIQGCQVDHNTPFK